MTKTPGIDYKKKYEELKARYIQALDVAFRAGYEQGFNESQVQSMAQQAQMAQQQAQMAGQAMPQPTEMEQPQDQGLAEDELDQAIAQLEQLVNKSEPSVDDLKKSIEMIKNERMHKKLSSKTKSIDITPKQYSQSYKLNLSENSKASVSMQQKVVDDILRKWESESANSSRDITQILSTEALTKKEK
jgi:hypothetical protein